MYSVRAARAAYSGPRLLFLHPEFEKLYGGIRIRQAGRHDFVGKYAASQELAELGRRIRDRRLAVRLSQETVAEKAGISVNTVSRIEQGQAAMSIEIFCRLLRVLDADAGELIGTAGAGTEEDCCFRDMMRKIRRLGKQEQETVLQTAERILDGLLRCGHM